MKQSTGAGQWNRQQLEQHLKSAVDALTPDIMNQIDLSTPQDAVLGPDLGHQALLRLQRRMRRFTLAAAACVCLALMGGGGFRYHWENGRVESVIGIDVNPSVELSINRKERVLEARGLNTEAQAIIEGMDLKGVDLNVAVNAVVGSMVTHGYLDHLDNAILVTVSNDSVRKAKELRASVVGDIEQTLRENQVEAVVYDQQVIEDEERKALAQRFGISYGKAYFLKELIDQNNNLDMEDMEELSSMTMEEIAKKIAEDSYELGELADRATEASTEEATRPSQPEPESASGTQPPPATQEEAPTETVAETTSKETQAPTTQAVATEEKEEEGGPVEIDYVDYEDGMVYVYFLTRVNWKKPSVVVRDEEGNSYAAMVAEASKKECSIEVSGLEGGKGYTFVLGGLAPAGSDTSVAVKGYFEKPEIAQEVEEDTTSGPDEEEDEGEGEEEAPSSSEAKEEGQESVPWDQTEEEAAGLPEEQQTEKQEEAEQQETSAEAACEG